MERKEASSYLITKGKSKKSKGLFTVLQSPCLTHGPLGPLGVAQLRAALRLPRAGLTPQQVATRELCQVPQQDETALYQVRIMSSSAEDDIKKRAVFFWGGVKKEMVTF